MSAVGYPLRQRKAPGLTCQFGYVHMDVAPPLASTKVKLLNYNRLNPKLLQ
jgi:hypothetical protein